MRFRFHHTVWMLAFLASAGWSQNSSPISSETPLKATVCQLLADPATWNHKLVQVTGLAAHGFEDSGFSDPECDSRYTGLWMEYGGSRATGTMSTASGLDRTREKPAVVEGIEIPLVADAKFQRFDELLHQDSRTGALVHATVIARFFAGSPQRFRGNRLGGYGHMGCCSLFVIQQVLSVDEVHNPNLDPSDTAAAPSWPTVNYITPISNNSNILAAQKAAEANSHSAAFSDPQKIALDFLLDYTKTGNANAFHLHTTASTPARITYEGSLPGLKAVYRVVVSRPAWLTSYASDPTRIAWVVIAAFATGRGI